MHRTGRQHHGAHGLHEDRQGLQPGFGDLPRNFIVVADGATPLGGGEQAARDTSLFALSLLDYLDITDPRPGSVLEMIPLATNAARRMVKTEDITSTLTNSPRKPRP